MEWVKRLIIGFRVIVLILLLLGILSLKGGWGLIIVLGSGIACEVKYPGLSTGTSKWIGPGRGEGYMWPIHLNLAIVESTLENLLTIGDSWISSDIDDFTWSALFAAIEIYRDNK